MTIASEIIRLQNDKAAICTAIENKGVTVGNVTLDDYACCIDAIQTGGGGTIGYVDMLIVGGGGNGGRGTFACGGGGGGGAGAMIVNYRYPISAGEYNIYVGGAQESSCVGDIVARCGGDGGSNSNCTGETQHGGCPGGSGGGGAGYINKTGGDGCGRPTGAAGGTTTGSCRQYGGGGGGGAVSAGCGGGVQTGLKGGDGGVNDFSGVSCYYSGGGGGGGNTSGGAGGNGGGGAGGCQRAGCNATFYGGGGGGGGLAVGSPLGGCGYQGIVIIRYRTDGSCGISPASTGGCQYSCGNYTIHCFSTVGSDTFTPVAAL